MSARVMVRTAASSRLMRLVCLSATLGALALALGPSAAEAAGPVQKHGYIPMADGAKLGYTVDLPAATGRFPVALVYDGYCEDVGALNCNDPTSAAALLDAGYAVLGVSIRGTSCSTGDLRRLHGAGVARRRGGDRVGGPPAHGRTVTLGMLGDSFPGITQVGVAGRRPPHLDAIAPFQVTTDLYRDVGLPGRHHQHGLRRLLGGLSTSRCNSYRSGFQQAANAGDAGCVLAQSPTSSRSRCRTSPCRRCSTHSTTPSGGPAGPARNAGPDRRPDVRLPDLAGRRGLQPRRLALQRSSTEAHLGRRRNGYHGMCELRHPAGHRRAGRVLRPLRQGRANGFERTPARTGLARDERRTARATTRRSWISGFSSSAIPPGRSRSTSAPAASSR